MWLFFNKHPITITKIKRYCLYFILILTHDHDIMPLKLETSMANTNQARKRARQADTKRDHNSKQRSALRTEIKKFRLEIPSTTERSKLSDLQSHIDKAAKKGIISTNRGKRLMQRLSSAFKQATANTSTA